MPHKVLLSWSSGKDSAWTLYELQQSPEYEVVGLLTTVNQAFNRVAMHSVRAEILAAQAAAAGLPLLTVPIPYPCSNDDYEKAMAAALKTANERWGMTHVAFGDLFLEDIRAYREEKMLQTDLTPVFPLWGRPTRELAEQMVDAGLRAYTTCIDPKKLEPSFVGRAFDHDFIADLPEGIDPCGERGEFHTCVYVGPMFNQLSFKQSLQVEVGETVERDGFYFADIMLNDKLDE